MDIRLARAEDLHAIMDLYHEVSDAMVDTPYDCRWRRDGHPSTDLVRGLISSGNMLVGTVGHEVIAAVGIDHDLGYEYEEVLWLVDAPPDRVAVLHLLVVARQWRGKGLSRQLLRVCLEHARSDDMISARLDATANNVPAIELYKSEGFQIVGRGSQDVGPQDNPHVPFVVMERPLRYESRGQVL